MSLDSTCTKGLFRWVGRALQQELTWLSKQSSPEAVAWEGDNTQRRVTQVVQHTPITLYNYTPD